jgi:hypothetical protein
LNPALSESQQVDPHHGGPLKAVKTEASRVFGRQVINQSRVVGALKSETGLPDFSGYNIPKREQMYQIATEFTN